MAQLAAIRSLEFAAYAEKALHDDARGTPGRLFYSLVKRKDGSMVTQSAEDRAMARFPSAARQELVVAAQAALGRNRAAGMHPEQGEAVEDALLGSGVGYVHAVLMQCFLPQQPTAARQYSTSHGKPSLLVEAGTLANPDRPTEWKLCDVPSGSKPRLILPYVIGEAVRDGSPEIDLGNSLAVCAASPPGEFA